MRRRVLPLIALVLGVAALLVAAGVLVRESSDRQARLDLTLQHTVDARREAIEQTYDTARTMASSMAANPAFADWYAVPRGPRARARVESTLLRIARLGAGFVDSLSFVGPSGLEHVRVTDGELAPSWQLSSSEGDESYFDIALELEDGEVHFTRPYRSEHTGRWVLTAATPVPAGLRRAVLRAEMSIDAFVPRGAALAPGETATIADHETGRVIWDLGEQQQGPRDAGAQDGLLRDVIRSDSEHGVVEAGGVRARFEHIEPHLGNSNHWLVVASSTAVPQFGLGTVSGLAWLHVGIGLALIAAAMVLHLRARRREGQRMARSEAARRAAERQSRTDPLTGLLNRRGLAERLRAELVRAARDGSWPGLLLADIDRFKAVNDAYGHRAGDGALVEVGRRLHAAARQYDVVARWGGEEFVVLIPGAGDPEALRASAERLRAAVAAQPVAVDDEVAVGITVSIGGAVARGGPHTAEELTDAADRAMYAAKRSGRDCVRLASDLGDDDTAQDEPESVRIAQALAFAASVREQAPALHCQQVAELAAATAEELDLPEALVLRCRLGGWVHDVGKVAIPDAVLGKPGPLDESEWELVRRHVEVGEAIVSRVPALQGVAEVVRHHHERYDGSGYPDGLTGEEIPIEARIVAAADAYSAIASERPYRGLRDAGAAIEEVQAVAGSQLDPDVVDALVRVMQAAACDAAEATAGAAR